jgi:hypothetical protein
MLLSRVRIVCASTLTAVFALGLNGCGAEEVKYKPRPAPSGARASLPPVPNVPKRPIKKGGAYTVWGDNNNDCIKVLGWASNYAQIFDTIEKRKEDEEAEHIDTYWGRPLPCPLPNLGAKVTVTGPYSTTFIGSSTGTEADPIMGILTHTKIDYHEPPPTPALLPGMEEDEK